MASLPCGHRGAQTPSVFLWSVWRDERERSCILRKWIFWMEPLCWTSSLLFPGLTTVPVQEWDGWAALLETAPIGQSLMIDFDGKRAVQKGGKDSIFGARPEARNPRYKGLSAKPFFLDTSNRFVYSLRSTVSEWLNKC